MRLTRNISETPNVLQELLNNPPTIKQADLEEFLRREDALALARNDLEAVGAQIAEMLAMGWPVEPGRFAAQIVSGKLKVSDPPRAEWEG